MYNPEQAIKPERNRGFRITSILLGIAFMLWLPREDVGLEPIIGYAVLWGIWIALRFYLYRKDSIRGWQLLLVGAVLGVGVPFVAVGLLIFKSGLHAHGFPEYSIVQLVSLLRQSFWWALGGGSIAGLWLLVRHFNAAQASE